MDNKPSLVRVLVWPDNTWLYEYEYDENEYAFKGDDYKEIYVPNYLDQYGINLFIREMHN